MRVIKDKQLTSGGPIGIFNMTYPDETVFAFNPLYLDIEIKDSQLTTLRLSASTSDAISKSITITLYKGKAKVYYSRILELFFDEVKHCRTKEITISLTTTGGENSVSVFSFSHYVIWGAIAMGERFDAFGVYKYNQSKPYLERNRVWFKNFPFTVTMFRRGQEGDSNIIQAKYDGKPYDDTLRVFAPVFSMLVEKLSDFNLNAANAIDGGDVEINLIVYSRQDKRFFGLTNDNTLYKTWKSPSADMYDHTFYNNGNKARTDMKWWLFRDHKFYHVDGGTGEILEVPYGYGGTSGLFELDPAMTFPDATQECTYRQDAPRGTSRSSVFDETFDYTFFNSSEYTTITNLIINNDTAGYYLRWIDRFGCFQYFLFKKGKQTIKNKLSGDTKIEQGLNAGMWFPNHSRDIHINGTTTCKCCATSLAEDIYAYVSTIITSPIIDLYLGKTKYGEEMWVPVNIVASSHNYTPKDILHDLEISFTMPDTQAQTL